jgi:transposase
MFYCFVTVGVLISVIFNNPKEFAVWLGLTPKQHASGNISKMGGITKRGDRYLRKQ